MSALTSEDFRRRLQDGEYSDIVLTCKGKKFNCHRLILCTISDFFQAACEHEFKEKIENCIDLPDDDPEVVSKALDWIYSGDYDTEVVKDSNPTGETPNDRREDEAGDEKKMRIEYEESAFIDSQNSLKKPSIVIENLKFHTLVYRFADKLGIEGLKNCSHICFMGLWADRLIMEPGFAALARLVFESTTTSDLDLRYDFLKACLSAAQEAENNKDFMRVVQECEGVAWNLGFAQTKLVSTLTSANESQAERIEFLVGERGRLLKEKGELEGQLKESRKAEVAAASELSRLIIKEKIEKSSRPAVARFCPSCGQEVDACQKKTEVDWKTYGNLDLWRTSCLNCLWQLTFVVDKIGPTS